MASINIPNNFTNGQVADAEQVDANFAAIALTVNGNLGLDNLTTSAENTWLKLASVADRRVAFGSAATGPWGGGIGTGTISHGLGATPVFVAASMRGGGSLFFNVHYIGAETVTSSQIAFKFAVDSGTGVNTDSGIANFYWLAIA